ncbi:hypothetical protein JK386_01645 [Nocardioides sp. zg-536]|uniref:DUF4878 domain-containing protein n=1 Tax=Nocardioides faecalis TaxID=2803858 RepID=A0A938Y280_9ACTN|nr:hypothetical protein [Nocardioides faecalis]MBM9458598.1 hypothetical protein [Nocardioides faecalis]MBS4752929.1 hypothetical protein [Nocardioides faecalis]QVI58597.1 hypothetical protein KG111_16735 [Nocardioides faecalis]
MSHQFPGPGQPGEQPPTQISPQGSGGTPPQYGGPGGYPPQQGGGYPPQQGGGYGGYGQPPAPGGYGPPGQGGGYPGGPQGYGPPPGGGGSKKGLIIGILVGVVALVVVAALVVVLVVSGGDDGDDDSVADDTSSATTSDSPTDSATDSPTATPTESTPTEVVTSEPPVTNAPSGDPTITARAFLDSLLEGDCLAVEGLTTERYFVREFTDQAGCKRSAGNLEMSNAEYTFDEPVTVATISTVTGDVYAPNTGKTLASTWLLDGSTGEWLVSAYSYVEK